MESELESLRLRLAEQQRLREEEQRLREEEQRLRGQEQRRREEAERLVEPARPRTITQYLQGCHELSLAINVITEATSTTQGDATKPAGRLFPQRIVPWSSFASQQEHIWEELSFSPSFHTRLVFPSSHQLDYVRSLLNPISSEIGLRNFERDTVENAVQKLFEEVYKDEELRVRLGLDGKVTFESHTNLGQPKDTSVDEALEQMSISGPATSTEASSTDRDESIRRGKGKGRRKQERMKVAGRAKGKGHSADQFCICRSEDNKAVPIVAIEYKAPHKVTSEEVIVGLASEIVPARDVINQEGDDFTFLSKSLMAAVITQLFSYMIGKGIQHGYLCTGETYVFLHIPDDPTMVYYHVCIPNLDVVQDDEIRLHRTAVAQVFAFILHAVTFKPPPQSWYDATETLDSWAVEYIDILKKIPETERKKERTSPAYRPPRWTGFKRSPIRTRSQCLPMTDSRPADRESSDDEGAQDPPTPTPQSVTRSSAKGKGRQGQARHSEMQKEVSSSETQKGTTPRQVRLPIELRPYCTHQCLLGLARGGSMDMKCPNVRDHGRKHINKDQFLRLLRDQLATDRGSDADCETLYLHGSRGASFKVRLSAHGYTVLAKAMREEHARHLEHENQVYNHLRPIQGIHVPVCLGCVTLKRPQSYDDKKYSRMLFLSWAGKPILNYVRADEDLQFHRIGVEALRALHTLCVLHRDPEPRNMLYDESEGRLMLIDFERSEIRFRKPLGVISPNRKRKRHPKEKKKTKIEDYDREVQCAEAILLRSFLRSSWSSLQRGAALR